MGDGSQIVTFFLTSSQPRAWVVIQNVKQESCVLEMSGGHANRWSASAWLTPGDYHCRYYCGDDQHVIYRGPARTTSSIDDGMDGIVSVEQTQGKVNSHSTNILIVEDNLTTLLALERLLQSDGYAVHIADGYQTALEVAKRTRLDLAICDIHLWDGDGCDLLIELQKLQTMKAIALTGYTLPEETEHYRDAGFAVVLHKPVQHSEILSAIASLHTLKEGRLVSELSKADCSKFELFCAQYDVAEEPMIKALEIDPSTLLTNSLG